MMIKHHLIKACEEEEVYFHAFLTSALMASDWSALLSGRFTPGEKPRYLLCDGLCKAHSKSGSFDENIYICCIYVCVYVCIYVVGSKSFRPDIQKPGQMENAVWDI